MHAPGLLPLLIVAVVVILLFGRGKISGMMGEVAHGIKAFQKGMRDEDGSQHIDTPPTTVTANVEAKEPERSKDA